MFEITGFTLPYFGRGKEAVFDPRLAAAVLRAAHDDASFACQFRAFAMFVRWKKAAPAGDRGRLTEYACFMEELLRLWNRSPRNPHPCKAFLEMMGELYGGALENHDGWRPESATSVPACNWPPLSRLAARI